MTDCNETYDKTKSDERGRILTPFVEHISNEDLTLLNDLLPWQCYTLDSQGRRFGKPKSPTKRNVPQMIPDPRIIELNKRIRLQDLQVLEIGCFEGIHTIALAQLGAKVVAIDSRIENIVKTIIRTWSFGLHVTAFKCDVETTADYALLPETDVVHHVGVLYHLVDPVSHLVQLLGRTRRAIMLDTHFAREGEATEIYEAGGNQYRFKHCIEGGRANAFAGMYDHAKWLPLDTLISLMKQNGFPNVDVAEIRDERNGARTLIYGFRG